MKPSLIRFFIFASVLTALGASVLNFLFLRESYTFRIATSGLLGNLDTWLADEDGRVLAATNQIELPRPWDKLPRPSVSEGSVLTADSTTSNTVLVRRAASDKPLYFVLRRTPPSAFSSLAPIFKLVLPIVLATSLLLALFFYLYSKNKAALARRVMGELKAGHLQARFPLTRLDEVGSMMATFNEMADQIEQLVVRLRTAERSRNELLRSLAHDLRTPLTSLSLLVESAAEAKATTPRSVLRGKMNLAHQELNYFKRLLEDLFVLSNLDDPFFVPKKQIFDPGESLFREIDRRQRMSQAKGIEIEFFLQLPPRETAALEVDLFLYERILRNALDNAEAYAKNKVWASIRTDAERSEIVIEIRDDGPGFSPSALADFGRKHQSRFLDTSESSRISMGLGSLIMHKIVSNLGGTMKADNWTLPNGGIAGARVVFHLPGKVHCQRAA